MEGKPSQWLCTNHRYSRQPDVLLRAMTGLFSMANRALRGRLPRETWVRCQLELDSVAPVPEAEAVQLEPVDDSMMRALERHPWHDRPQMVTARRLWRYGLRRAFVWRDDSGEPLCMQWLLIGEDLAAARQMTEWGGMYPPAPDDTGQVENLITLPRGLRQPGGAATVFAFAMFDLARRQGLRRLVTHISERNTGALLWAERTGWSAIGSIHRHHLDLRFLRGRYIYLHTALPPQRIGAHVRLNRPRAA